MRSKSYVINAKPIAWQRSGHNGHHFYDRQKNEKIAYGLYILKHHGDEPIFEGPLSLDVIFYMPQPRLLRNRSKSGYHDKVPDIDNLLKHLMDSITQTKVVWNDDKQVAQIYEKKIYAKTPRIEFTISEIE